MKVFNRYNPSKAYGKLLELYEIMHGNGYRLSDGRIVGIKDAFVANELVSLMPEVTASAKRNGVQTILDYGAGKGRMHEVLASHTGASVRVYEPAIQRGHPTRVDMTICLNVLDHCFVHDIPWILDEIFQISGKAVFASVHCYGSEMLLPNGDNAHITIRPPAWWAGVFFTVSSRYPDVDWELFVHTKDDRLRYYRDAYVDREEDSKFYSNRA